MRVCVCHKTVEINIWILILILIDLLTGARAFSRPAAPSPRQTDAQAGKEIALAELVSEGRGLRGM